MNESDNLVMLAMLLLEEIATGELAPEEAVNEYAVSISDGISNERMAEI